MNPYLLTLLALMSLISSSQAQTQKIIAKFMISDARKNKMDITPTYVQSKAYFVFYTVSGETLPYFGNIMPGKNTQSYGQVYQLDHTHTDETTTEYEADTYAFKWSYHNSYDNKEGTADVRLVKIIKPAGVTFTLTMVPENLDVFVYKGYMEGSLNLLQ